MHCLIRVVYEASRLHVGIHGSAKFLLGMCPCYLHPSDCVLKQIFYSFTMDICVWSSVIIVVYLTVVYGFTKALH